MGRGTQRRFRTRYWFGGDPCVYCLGPATTKEHILPRSYGGSNEWSNLAPCCHTCNKLRGNLPLLKWLLLCDLRRRGREAARKWQSRTLRFTKEDARRMGLHQ